MGDIMRAMRESSKARLLDALTDEGRAAIVNDPIVALQIVCGVMSAELARGSSYRTIVAETIAVLGAAQEIIAEAQNDVPRA